MSYDALRGYAREQVIERLLSVPYPREYFGEFRHGHLYIGTKSLHRRTHARMYRTMCRMKKLSTKEMK